jgi:hypothetical protein
MSTEEYALIHVLTEELAVLRAELRGVYRAQVFMDTHVGCLHIENELYKRVLNFGIWHDVVMTCVDENHYIYQFVNDTGRVGIQYNCTHTPGDILWTCELPQEDYTCDEFQMVRLHEKDFRVFMDILNNFKKTVHEHSTL